MKCIVRKYLRMKLENRFIEKSRSTSPSVDDTVSSNVQPATARSQIVSFLQWALNIDSHIALESYRLLSGLMHRRLVNKISESLTVTIDDSMVLGSQRFFPSDLAGEGAVFGKELMYGKFNRKR
jgi:hypothetical protein